MWGDVTVPADFGPWDEETEGAGVRGGGGEDVVGVDADTGESRSKGLGVRRGGMGVVGVVEEDVLESGVEVGGAWGGATPLMPSEQTEWFWWGGFGSILQQVSTGRQRERGRKGGGQRGEGWRKEENNSNRRGGRGSNWIQDQKCLLPTTFWENFLKLNTTKYKLKI